MTKLNKKLDDKVTSDEKKKTELPQIELKNPYRVDVFVTNILLLPDAFFSRKGQVTVKVGDITVLDESDAGTYERNKSIQISLNEEILKRNESIKIWFWNGIDDDAVTITALAKISENPSDTSQTSDTWNSDEIDRLVSSNYIDRPIQFLSDTLSGKLDSVKSSVDSENVDLQAKIQSLINSLPASPANADIIAKLQALINVLPDSPDNAGLLAALNGIITSVDDENTDLQAKLQNIYHSIYNTNTLTLVTLLWQINVAISTSGAGAYRTALSLVKTDLEGLKNGFDIDELTDTIDTMQNNIVTIRNNNSSLGNYIDVFKVELEQILTNAKLNKSKKGILFPKQVYYNSSTPIFFNTKGYRNIIITMAGSTIPDLIAYSDIVKTLNIGSHYFTFSPIGTYILDSTIGMYCSLDGFTNPSSLFSFVYGVGANNAYSKLIETETTQTVYDMGEIGNHILEFYFSLPPPVYNGNQIFRNQGKSRTIYDDMKKRYFIRIEESNSPTSGFTLISNYVESGSGTKTYSGITKRYVKIKVHIQVYLWVQLKYKSYHYTQGSETCTFAAMSQNVNRNTMFSNVVDKRKKSGTAYLSIEIKDAFGEWFTLVTATELGTITEGTKTIRSFGEALRNKALPATQDSLRFVLTVIGGGIETGVSVMRVA